jgi:hypothetical protein
MGSPVGFGKKRPVNRSGSKSSSLHPDSNYKSVGSLSDT